MAALCLLPALLIPLDASAHSAWSESGDGFGGGQPSDVELSDGAVRLALKEAGGDNWTKLGDGVPELGLGEPFYDPATGELLMPGGRGWLWRYDLALGRWSVEVMENMPPCYGEMVYDSAMRRFVLFGTRWWFRGSYTWTNQTWVLDLDDRTWTNVTKLVAPSPREDFEMVIDEANRVVVLFGGYRYGSLGETWSLDLPTLTWSRVITTPEPSRRDDHHMVYDPDAKLCILHGGHYGQNPDPQSGTWAFNASNGTWSMFPFGDVWPYESYYRQQMVYDRSTDLVVLFDGSRTWTFNRTAGEWTPMAPAAEPVVTDFEMTYSDAAGATVLFGCNWTAEGRSAVWTYNCTSDEWTEVAPRELPTPKVYDIVSFDSANGQAVAYGGYCEYMSYNYISTETWSYDIRTNEWTQMHPAKTPMPLVYHGMTYDSKQGVHVLFGGASVEHVSYTNETWTYDLGTDTWSNLTTADSPPARTSGAMAFDEGAGVVVLFGGNVLDSGRPMDTWTFDTATRTWTELETAERPPARDYSTVYDRANGRIVAFSGPDQRWFAWSQWLNYNYTEVWSLDVANATWTNRSGPGCPLSRTGFAMAYDEARGETVILGGQHPSYSYSLERWVYTYENLTWGFNLSTGKWAPRGLSPPLANRSYCSMGFCEATGSLYVMGGRYLHFAEFTGEWRLTSDVWASNVSAFPDRGTYTSRPWDTGGEPYFGHLTLSATTGADTWLGVQLRSADTEANLTSRPFVGPDGTEGSFHAPGTSRLSAALDGSRWVQYRAELRTYNVLVTPELLNVTVGYNLRHALRVVSPAGGESWAGPRTFVWEADDPDNDTLAFDVLLVNSTSRLRVASGLPDGARSAEFDLVSVADGAYRVLVEARDDDTDIPLVSNATSGEFTVLNHAPTVELLSPRNGVLVGTVLVDLAWNGSDVDGNSLHYRVVVSDVQFQPSSVPPTGTSTSASSLEVGPLVDGRTYYWTVVPFDGRLEGPVVQIWSLTVQLPRNTPPDVVLLSPGDGAVVNGGSVALRWDATDADGDPLAFDVLVSTAPFDLGAPPIPRTTTGALLYTLADLIDGATYYWTVVADDSNGSRTGPFPRSFFVQTTHANRPPTAELLSPAEGALVTATAVRLEWSGDDEDGDAVTFFLVLSTQPFASTAPPPFLTSTMAHTHLAEGLSDGATYYWTVVPHDGRTNGTAPAVRRFTVGLPPPNLAPRFTGAPPANATVGEALVHRLTAVDDDGDALTYELVDGPEGMVLDNASGTLGWTPAPGQEGDRRVAVRVADGMGGVADLEFTVHVKGAHVPAHVPPWCRIVIPVNGSRVKGTLPVNGTSGPGSQAVTGIEVRVDGGEWLPATGTGDWTFPLDTKKLADGEHTIEARARDGTAVSGVVDAHFTVRNERTSHGIPGPGTAMATLALALAVPPAVRARRHRKC